MTFYKMMKLQLSANAKQKELLSKQKQNRRLKNVGSSNNRKNFDAFSKKNY